MDFTPPLTPEQHTALEEYFADWQHKRKPDAIDAFKNCNYPIDLFESDAVELAQMCPTSPMRAETWTRLEKDHVGTLFQGSNRKLIHNKKLVSSIVQYAIRKAEKDLQLGGNRSPSATTVVLRLVIRLQF